MADEGRTEINHMRIGIFMIGNKEWMAGVSYLENLAKAVRLLPAVEQPQLFLISGETNLAALELHYDFLHLFDGFCYAGRSSNEVKALVPIPFHAFNTWPQLFSLIDFCFLGADEEIDEYCSAAWVPDFQFMHLPILFSQDEIQVRTAWIRSKAKHSPMIVFSSKDAENDFKTLIPDATAATRILHFHTLPDMEMLREDPEQVQRKYNLPDSFIICCNQFWMHKDHATLFRAFALLRDEGLRVHLVCTGGTGDYRNRSYFEELLDLINELGIKDQVQILGHIPRHDQLQLIRRSLCIVQPSLFEGWSTVVEDARSLGKTILLSDLAVHLEQAPDFSIYFRRSDPVDLTEKLMRLLPLTQPGPIMLRETSAVGKSALLAANFGRTFCDIARETIAMNAL